MLIFRHILRFGSKVLSLGAHIRECFGTNQNHYRLKSILFQKLGFGFIVKMLMGKET